jgi:hypothetical protein
MAGYFVSVTQQPNSGPDRLPVDVSTLRSESRCALRLGYVDFVVSIEVAAEVCCYVISLDSVVKQRLKCYTGKVCNCLIQFLLAMVRGHHFRHLL